jgi:hypothetical protein
MLTSRIMQGTRRTTVAASVDALATLDAEAKRRGVPLTVLLKEAVEAKAVEIRSRRRPRLGIARSTDGLAAREVTAEPVARPLR